MVEREGCEPCVRSDHDLGLKGMVVSVEGEEKDPE